MNEEFEQLKSNYEGQLVEYRLHGSIKTGRILRLSMNSRTGKPNAHIDVTNLFLTKIIKHQLNAQSQNLQLLGKADRSSRLSLTGEKFEYKGPLAFYSCPNNKFKVGDRVVWNYDRESAGEPPVGKVEFIGTVTVAVVQFEKESSHLPGYLSSKQYGGNTNVVKIQELEELKRWHRASQCSLKSLQDFINSTTPVQVATLLENPDASSTEKLKNDEEITEEKHHSKPSLERLVEDPTPTTKTPTAADDAAIKTDEDEQQQRQEDTYSKPTTSKNQSTPIASSSPPVSPIPALPPKQNKKQLKTSAETAKPNYFQGGIKWSPVPGLLIQKLPAVNPNPVKAAQPDGPRHNSQSVPSAAQQQQRPSIQQTNEEEMYETVPHHSPPIEENIPENELQPRKEKSARSRLPALVIPKSQSDLATPANRNSSPVVETESATCEAQSVIKQSQIPRREPSPPKHTTTSLSPTPTSPPPPPSSIPVLRRETRQNSMDE